MKNLMKKTLSLGLTLLLVGASAYAQDPPQTEDPAVVAPLVQVVEQSLLALPYGSLEGVYAVKLLQGEKGTMAEVFAKNFAAWMDEEAIRSQRLLIHKNADRDGRLSSDVLKALLIAAQQKAMEEAAAAAVVEPEVTEIPESP